jgi:hypothetical protein
VYATAARFRQEVATVHLRLAPRSQARKWTLAGTAAFLEADEAGQPGALERLHRHLAEVQPYRPLGQYDQPIAFRANVSGVLASPVTVYWNISKN